MKHLKSINEIFGLFKKKKKDDDIAEMILNNLSKLSKVDIEFTEDHRNDAGANFLSFWSIYEYKFSLQEIPCHLKVTDSLTTSFKSGHSSERFYLKTDNIELDCNEKILKKIKEGLDKILNKEKEEETEFIKKDIRRTLYNK